MKFTALPVLGLVASASAFPHLLGRAGPIGPSKGLNRRDDPPMGVWQAPGPDDVRAPCTFMNTMANHGYFPRDGRGITFAMMEEQFLKAMSLSPEMTAILALASLTTRGNETQTTLFDIKSSFGTRMPGEVNDHGIPYINLDDLDYHGGIEHDASLVRLDTYEGDNHSINPELLEQFLNSTADGEYFTQEDIAAYRKMRFQLQKRINPTFTFGPKEEAIAFGEVGLVVGLFGQPLHDFRVPLPFMRSLFALQKLPIEEGWVKRSLPLTAVETGIHLASIKAKAGLFSS